MFILFNPAEIRADQKARRTRSFRAGVQSAPAEGRFWPSMYWRRWVGLSGSETDRRSWRRQAMIGLLSRNHAPRKRYAVLAAPLPRAAWAAARRAIGTRNGEHDT